MNCNHWWRRKSEFLGKRGCKKCLDTIEFRFEMAMERMVKGTFDLFEQFKKLPKETQDKIVSQMNLGSIYKD